MHPIDLLPALPWAAPFGALFRLARREPDLGRAPRATGRLVSVVIPARNEADTIETVLGSLRATTYAPVEILVVDDRSDDATASLVAEQARQDGRVRLIPGDPLPNGWFGKPWACLQGARAAGGDLLLFTDADTRHAPALLAHAVGALEQEGADLLTVAPTQRCETFWERVTMPIIWFFLGVRFSPRGVNRARRARDVIANGQFILIRREAYEAIGTHRAVRDQVAEDLALAQRCFRAGRRLYFAHAPDLMETRMYRSLGQLVEGWSKNVFLGGRASFPDEPLLRALVPLMLLGSILFLLAPPVALGLGLAGAIPLAPWIVAATAAQALFWMVVSGGMRIPAVYGLAYPAGGLVVLTIFLRSIRRGARRVEWRGRRYSAERVARGTDARDLP